MTYEVEKKPLKLRTENPGEVDFLCELAKGRFAVTANVNHGGKLCTAKIFDKVAVVAHVLSSSLTFRTKKLERLSDKNILQP